MCMKLLNAEKKVATKDITVYKRFDLYHRKGDVYYLSSPYKSYRYELGKTYESKFTLNWNSIEKGLHAYTTKKQALVHRRSWEIIIKCTIPKGAKYYLGTTNTIASDTLVLPESFVWKGYEYTINYE